MKNSILNQTGPSNARTRHSARNFDFNAVNNTCVEKEVLPKFECLFHLQTHQPHDLMFSFLYISTTQWQMWRFQGSNSSFPQERWKWSPTSPASATSAAASPRCIDIHCWKVLRLEPTHEALEDDFVLFKQVILKFHLNFPGISYRLGMEVAHKKDSSHQDDLNGI